MFNLTRQERQIIIFLATIALIGVGVNFFCKSRCKIKAVYRIYQDFAKIDLNQAPQDLLVSVPGIGEKTAARIIEYRNTNSGFTSVEELKNIKGITGSKFNKIKDYFLVAQ